MKSVSQIIQSPAVSQKLEGNSTFQLDNPNTSKPTFEANSIKLLPRKRVKPKLNCSQALLHSIQKSSLDYHKISSRK